MRIGINAQRTIGLAERTDKKLDTALAQMSSGLQNPNRATDPLASTLAKGLDINITATKKVQSVVTQTKAMTTFAWYILHANARILENMKSQAIEASHGIHTDTTRKNNMQPAFQQNLESLDANAHSQWGSRTLFDGTFSINCQIDTQATLATVTGSAATAELNAGDLLINGTDIGATTAGGAGIAVDIATTINAQSDTTNVIAALSTVTAGAITLSSLNTITISGAAPEKAGFTATTTTPLGVTTIAFGDMRIATIFGSPLPDVTTQANAQAAIDAINTVLATVFSELTRISAYGTQLENTETNMGITSSNLQSSLSIIEDADFAESVTDSKRLEALKDAAIAALRMDFKSDEQFGQLVKESL